MAAQQDQQATSSTTARPQQPTDAPGASLPTETLAQILKSSFEGLNPWERQQAMISFAKTCVGWYGAVDMYRELAVKDSNMAERCASTLAKTSAEQRASMRSLSVQIEKKGAGRSQRVASVVKACPKLETLELHGFCYLGTREVSLGAPLTQALKDLTKIEHFKMSPRDHLGISGGDLMRILMRWPGLTALSLPDVKLNPWPHHLPWETATPRLSELHLPLWPSGSVATYIELLESSESTLRHLHLGAFATTGGNLTWILTALSRSLETIAPRLITLKADFDCSLWGNGTYTSSDALTSMLTALRDIEALSLGVLGFDFATTLPLLQPLAHLHTLSLSHSKLGATEAPFHRLTSQSAIDFLGGAVALEALTLPRQLGEVWTEDELVRVKAVAEQKNVRFALEREDRAAESILSLLA